MVKTLKMSFTSRCLTLCPALWTTFTSVSEKYFTINRFFSCVFPTPGTSIVRWGGAGLTIQVVNTENIKRLPLFFKFDEFSTWKSWICDEVEMKSDYKVIQIMERYFGRYQCKIIQCTNVHLICIICIMYNASVHVCILNYLSIR